MSNKPIACGNIIAFFLGALVGELLILSFFPKWSVL